jgi:hypothetical protein
MGCPACANRQNMLFVSDIVSLTETTTDDFVLLSPADNKHVSSPKFIDSNGDILIYLENDIESTFMDVNPGPDQKSRRLIRMNFTQSVTVAMSSDGMIYGAPYIYTVVDQVYDPIIKEDGELFRGLYPIGLRTPDRIFSNDGEITYLNVYQREAYRIIAVNIFSGKVAIHPDKNLRVVDVMDKIILVINTGNANRSPTMQLGLLVPPPPTPPTTSIEPTSRTTSVVHTTSSGSGTTDTPEHNSTFDSTTNTPKTSTTPSSTSIDSVTTSAEPITLTTPATTRITLTMSPTSNTTAVTEPITNEATLTTTSQPSSEGTTSSTIDPCEDLLQELEEADVSGDERFRREVSKISVPKDQISNDEPKPVEDLVVTAILKEVHSILQQEDSFAHNLLYVKFFDVMSPFPTFDYH